MKFIDSYDRWAFSMMIQDMTDIELDQLGKRKKLDITRLAGKIVVYHDSALTGHSGYRAWVGPEQRPWWYTFPEKTYLNRSCKIGGSRDPLLVRGTGQAMTCQTK